MSYKNREELVTLVLLLKVDNDGILSDNVDGVGNNWTGFDFSISHIIIN